MNYWGRLDCKEHKNTHYKDMYLPQTDNIQTGFTMFLDCRLLQPVRVNNDLRLTPDTHTNVKDKDSEDKNKIALKIHITYSVTHIKLIEN